MTTLQEALAKGEEFAVATFDPESETLPKFIAFEPDDNIAIFATPFHETDGDQGEMAKQIILQALRKRFKEAGVKAYAFISEAWTVVVDQNTEPAIAKLKPSQRNDRQEILHILAADAEDCLVAIYDIDREHEPHLKRRNDEATRMEGRMTSLLR